MLITPIIGKLRQEANKFDAILGDIGSSRLAWTLSQNKQTNKPARFRLWRDSHQSFGFLLVKLWFQSPWRYPLDMGMLHHPQLSHSRTKSHIPGAPPPQGEAAEPKGRESLSQDKVPRCTSAPRLFMGPRTAPESWRRGQEPL